MTPPPAPASDADTRPSLALLADAAVRPDFDGPVAVVPREAEPRLMFEGEGRAYEEPAASGPEARSRPDSRRAVDEVGLPAFAFEGSPK